MASPIQNPGVSPIQPTPEPDRKNIGEEDEGQQKPFALPAGHPTAGASQPQAAQAAEKPSPMDVARDAEKEHKPQWTPGQMQENVGKLRNQLSKAQENLSDPNVTQKLTKDHHTALSRLVDKMTPDMRTIAKNTHTPFSTVTKKSDESVLGHVIRWIDGSQDTLSGALNYLGQDKKPDPASYLKLQFAVQRATQRGELFASIIGSSVSGIKTIMSTQLG